jgi:hypothetical protein
MTPWLSGTESCLLAVSLPPPTRILLAWLDGDSGITCEEIVDLVTELVDSVAAHVALSPTH